MTDGSYIRESYETIKGLGTAPEEGTRDFEGVPAPDVPSVVPSRQKLTLGRLARPMTISSPVRLGFVAWSMLAFFSGPHPGSCSVYSSAP